MCDILIYYICISFIIHHIYIKCLLYVLCFRSLSIYFVMFGINAAPFFDISAPLYGNDEKKTKFPMGIKLIFMLIMMIIIILTKC